MNHVFVGKRAYKYFTAFISGSTHPGFCGIIVEAVVPEVSDFWISPYPPWLQRERDNIRKRNNCKKRDNISHQGTVHLTFSRVAMRSMAKVTRCSTVRDMSRKTIASCRWGTSLVSCVQTTNWDVIKIVEWCFYENCELFVFRLVVPHRTAQRNTATTKSLSLYNMSFRSGQTVGSLSASRGNSEHFHHASEHLHWQSLPIYQATLGGFLSVFRPWPVSEEYIRTSAPCDDVNKLVIWTPVYQRSDILFSWIWIQTLYYKEWHYIWGTSF